MSARTSKFVNRPFQKCSIAVIILILAIATNSIGGQEFNPQFRKPVDCSKLRNGNYVFGCSGFWSICSNNIEHPMKCATGLVLNPENDQCNEPLGIPVCSKSIVALGDRLYRSKDPFSCKGQPDGNYEAQPCSGFYFQCHQGNRNEMPCPIGTVFNSANGACDYPESCEKSRKLRAPMEGVEIIGQDGNLQSDEVLPKEIAPKILFRSDAESQTTAPLVSFRRSRMFGANQPILNSAVRPPSYSPIENTVPESKPVSVPGVPLEDTFIVSQAPIIPLEQQQNQAQGQTQDPIPTYNVAQSSSMSKPPLPAFNCIGRRDAIYLWKANACTQSFWKCSNGQPFKYNCPETLYYNTVNGQCDYKQNIIACGGRPAAVEPLQIPPALPSNQIKKVDLRCAGKKDDHYTEKNCAPDFYSCTAGHTNQLRCPSGLVYDATSKTCEFLEDCGKARPTLPPQNPINQGLYHGGLDYYFKQNYRTPTSSTPSNVGQTTQASPSSATKFNCSGRADGYYYKKACTATFVICSAGQISEQFCPGILLFDPATIACQYPDECGKPVPTTTTTVASPQKDVAEPKEPEFDCAGLKDGYYVKQPCTTTFYTCVAGHSIKVFCPPTLVFDPVSERCDYPHECGRPKKNETSKSKAADSSPISAQTAPPTTKRPPVNFDCNGKKDGYYAKGNCQPTFMTCAAGIAIEIECPSGLVFDINKSICDWIGNCGKVLAANPQSNNAQQQTPFPTNLNKITPNVGFAPIPQSLKLNAATTTTQAPVQAAPRGVHLSNTVAPAPQNLARVAQQPYYASNPLVTQNPLIDYVPLFQDYATQQPQQVVQREAQEYFLVPPPPQQEQPQPADAEKVTLPTQPIFSCAGRKDGFYIKKDCTPTFFACSGGIGSKQDCPGNLVFDISTTTCQFPDVCGKPVPSTTTTTQSPQQLKAAQKPNFDCSRQENGNYALGKNCANSSYVICSNGFAYAGTCPGGLVFDQIDQCCTFAEKCQTSANRTSNPVCYSAMVQPAIQPQSIPTTVDPQALLRRTEECRGKPSGFHSVGCESYFLHCNGGETLQLHCPNGLFYDSETETCEYREFVKACGGKSKNPEQVPPIHLVSKQKPNSVTTTTTANPIKCGSKEGYFSKGCSSTYFACVSGIGYAFACPHHNLRYNQKAGRCDLKEFVPECEEIPKMTSADPQSPETSPIKAFSSNQPVYTQYQAPVEASPINTNQPAYDQKPVVAPPLYIRQKKVAPETPPITTEPNKVDATSSTSNSSPKVALVGTETAPSLGDEANTAGDATPALNNSSFNNDVAIASAASDKPNVMPAAAPVITTPSVGQLYDITKPPVAAAPVIATLQTPTVPPPKFDCSKHKDGYVSNDCSSIYFYCSAGRATPLYCPANLKYSAKDDRCEEISFVPECGGKSRPNEEAPANRHQSDMVQKNTHISKNITATGTDKVADYFVPGSN